MKKIVLSGLVVLLVFVFQVASANAVDRSPAKPVLEREIYIHHKKGFAKPPSVGDSKAPACYGVMSKGAKLKATKDIVVDPALDLSAIAASTSTWDSQTGTSLFGSLVPDASANWDGSTPDTRNELSYGDYPDSGVIAITVAWGYFSGPIQSREIFEFDIMFNTDFAWGNADTDLSVMDLENIATHEIGHGVGLADIYTSSCSPVTMYGYSDNGEKSKRTLETPDIKGLQSLYGI